jgi:hypothetical protein
MTEIRIAQYFKLVTAIANAAVSKLFRWRV